MALNLLIMNYLCRLRLAVSASLTYKCEIPPITHYNSDRWGNRWLKQIYLPNSGIILIRIQHSLAQLTEIITAMLETGVLVEAGTSGG